MCIVVVLMETHWHHANKRFTVSILDSNSVTKNEENWKRGGNGTSNGRLKREEIAQKMQAKKKINNWQWTWKQISSILLYYVVLCGTKTSNFKMNVQCTFRSCFGFVFLCHLACGSQPLQQKHLFFSLLKLSFSFASTRSFFASYVFTSSFHTTSSYHFLTTDNSIKCIHCIHNGNLKSYSIHTHSCHTINSHIIHTHTNARTTHSTKKWISHFQRALRCKCYK